MLLEIDSRCRVLIFKPMIEAKKIDLMDDQRKARLESKEKEMELYQKHKDILMDSEINRLRNNANQMTVVTDFDCGPCAHCKIKDRSVCDNGYNCKKNRRKR